MGIAGDIKTLGEDIVASYDTRVKGEKDRLKEFKIWWSAIQNEVQGLLEKFRKEHAAMADELKKALAKGETERLKEFKPWWSAIQNEVQGLLEKFAKEHAAMADELKKALAKGETERLKEFKSWWSDIEKEVADLLEAFKAEREEMAANWQALTATMDKRRGEKPVVGAGAEVKTVE